MISTTAESRFLTNARSDSLAGLQATYRDQDEMLFLPEFVGPAALATIRVEAQALKPRINRNFVPGFKKGGSVSYFTIRNSAPAIHALYHDPELLEFVGTLTGTPVLACPESDPHACALYYYTEAGDRIGWHYDTSHYEGRRYTLLLGLEERSSSELVCQLWTKAQGKEVVEVRLKTTPGSLCLFNGDTIYHSVTPCAADEERVILTLEYVTDQRMPFVSRIVSSVKDSVAYFGWKSLFRR